MTAGPDLSQPAAPADRRPSKADGAPSRLGGGRRSSGRRIALFGLVALAWAVTRAGVGNGLLNLDGLPAFGRFWAAISRPELGAEFLSLTAEAALVTLAYAVLGIVLAVAIGAVGALGLSSLLWPRRGLRLATGMALTLPRGVHEVLWALFLIQILGFDPLVPVLAIGIPYGAVAAKVFAEAIDEADPGPYRLLRAAGAGRLTALAYGVVPSIRGELVSYVFYRLECGIRSAAVLGVIGAGGLGFQLDLSFETLRYHEIWTLIAALMVLSGGVEIWSSVVRRHLRTTGPVDRVDGGPTSATRQKRSETGVSGRDGRPVLALTGLAAAALVPLSWIGVGLDPRALFDSRARTLAADLASDILSPRLGPGGWAELIEASIDTMAMSILALVVAVVGALILGPMATAADEPVRPGPVRTGLRLVARTFLLLTRAVPAPIWAFLMVLVLFPGLWPGAVALGIYTLGVLGRLYAETFEDRDRGPARMLAVTGASPSQAFLYGSLPAASPRLIALALYRWEVVTRETVVVGVVGAGGLGQLVNEHLAARDFRAVMSAVLALILIAVVIDVLSGRIRHLLRGPAGADRDHIEVRATA